MSHVACTLIKVGGSLYDLPDLGKRLRSLLARLACPHVILFPGGGAAADEVRNWDRVHGLGEEAAHWLALRALTFNAFFLKSLLPEVRVTTWPEAQETAILDPYAFAHADATNQCHLPHTWEVTSDSLAARAAHVLGAEELLLLKSSSLANGMTWADAAQIGFVDGYFPTVLAQAPALKVTAVDFRTSPEEVGPACRAGPEAPQNKF